MYVTTLITTCRECSNSSHDTHTYIHTLIYTHLLRQSASCSFKFPVLSELFSKLGKISPWVAAHLPADVSVDTVDACGRSD